MYDGLGLETEPNPPVVDLACSGCGAALALAVARVLVADPIRSGDPDADALERRFRLDRRGTGEWLALVTRLGLTPYRIDLGCQSCGRRHLAVVGYGEFQPARYLAVFQGLDVQSS